jgi:hypothetical protein
MGAQSFVHTIEAASASEAFNRLVESAIYHHGNDSYNGTISTCSMGRCKKSFSDCSKKTEKEARDFIEAQDNGEKWIAHYVDLGVVRSEEITVKKKPKKYTAVYKQLFGVYSDETGRLINSRATFKTKGEADTYAIKCILDGNNVTVKKCPVHISGNDVVSEFEIAKKVIKKSSATKPNSKIIHVHKYMFYGWASC